MKSEMNLQIVSLVFSLLVYPCLALSLLLYQIDIFNILNADFPIKPDLHEAENVEADYFFRRYISRIVEMATTSL